MQFSVRVLRMEINGQTSVQDSWFPFIFLWFGEKSRRKNVLWFHRGTTENHVVVNPGRIYIYINACFMSKLKYEYTRHARE